MRAVTQVPKCTASATPASSVSRSVRPRTSGSSSRLRDATATPMPAVANPLRQNAIASGGTTIAAINGPDNDTPTTPTAISSRVRTGPFSARAVSLGCGSLGACPTRTTEHP